MLQKKFTRQIRDDSPIISISPRAWDASSVLQDDEHEERENGEEGHNFDA